MFEDVESFLNNQIGVEPTSQILEALSLLDTIGYDDHVFPLRNMMADVDNHEGAESVGYIRSIVNDNYVLILRSMSVEVAEETPLSILYSLLFTLSNIESYENKLEIKAIIDNGKTSEEILAEFIKLFRGDDLSVTLEYILSVSSDLIERIDDLCQKEIKVEQESEWLDRSTLKDNAKRFFLAHPGTFVRQLIADGYPIGNNRDIYIKALEEHFSTFDPTPEQYALELLAIVVVTDVVEINNTAKILTELFIYDTAEMFKVNALIDKIHLELFPYEKG